MTQTTRKGVLRLVGKVESIEQVRKKFKLAKDARSPFEEDLREAFYFALRQDFLVGGKNIGGKQKMKIEVLDSTASEATESKVEELQSTIFPLSRPFITFKRNSDDVLFDAELAAAEDKFHQAILHSNFYTEINLALKHAMISSGSIVVARGENNDPLRFRAVPMWKVYHGENMAGELNENFVVSQLTWEEIYNTYSKYGELSKAGFANFDESDLQTSRLDVVEYYKTNTDGSTDFMLFTTEKEDEKGSAIILQLEGLKDLRFISFRYDRICGSVHGRGPVLKALPEIRMVNEVSYYGLEKMIQNLSTIYAFDHNIINPQDLMGDGHLTTIDVPNGTAPPNIIEGSGTALQHEQFVLDTLRGDIHRKIGNDPLPRPEQGTRRTAEEFRLRSQNRAFNIVPDAANLERELFVPVIDICMYILSMDIMQGSRFSIAKPATDDKGEALWRFEPENYLVASSKQQKADLLINAVATNLQLFPEDSRINIKMDEVSREIASLSGIPDKFLRTEEEADELRQQLAEAAAQAQQQPPQAEQPLLEPRPSG